jgi:hypothetical protein
MFAVQYYKMYVKQSDETMSSDKSTAKLFNTAKEAEDWVTNHWIPNTKVSLPPNREPINIIEVETKPVIHKVLGTIKSF